MLIQVLLKERINEFDFREWIVPITCGKGLQPLRWLGHAACARMAYDNGDVPAKYVPQAVRSVEGQVYFPDKRIVDVLKDGAQVEVECSRGPESFTMYWDGKEPPKVLDFFPKDQSKKSEDSTEAPALIAATSGDWATEVIGSIDWTKHELGADLNNNYETWETQCGTLQAVLLWYCSKGEELQEKDFGVLNFEQFRQIFVDANLCTDQTVEDHVKVCFDKALKANNVPGAYQLSTSDFIPAVVRFVSAPFYEALVPDRDKTNLSTKVSHITTNFFVPCLNAQLNPELQQIRKAASAGSVCMDVLKENKDLFRAAVKSCNRDAQAVDFKILLPYLKKWLVLGDHWDPHRAAVLMIYAFQDTEDAATFQAMPLTTSFGAKHLRKFLFGASHYAFKASNSLIKISEHAYLRDFLHKVFKRAGVAKPLYSTYEEKKEYLRKILLRG